MDNWMWKLFPYLFGFVFCLIVLNAMWRVTQSPRLIAECKSSGGTVIQDSIGIFDGCVTGPNGVGAIVRTNPR